MLPKIKKCEHCGAEFQPYNGRQRICGKPECKKWLLETYHPLSVYRFSNKFLSELKKNGFSEDTIKSLASIEFTKNDIIRIR